MLLLKILALLISIFIASIFLNKNVVKLDYRFYRFLIFPGIALHEIAHIAGCLVTGSHVVEAQIFSSSGGYVKHTRGRFGHLGDWIISFSPVIFGFFTSFVIFYFFRSILYYKPIYLLISPLVLYLQLSLFLTMMPSKQDLSNSVLGTLIVMGLLYLSDKYGLFNLYMEQFYNFLIIILIMEVSVNIIFLLVKSLKRK